MKSSAYRFDFADWGKDEYISILKSVTLDYRKELESVLENDFSNSEVILMNSARSGLFIVLEHLKKAFPERQQVLIPAYICPSVPETVTKAGLEPVPVGVADDLNISLEHLERQLSDNILAVICVHMYGKEMDMERAEMLCRKYDVFLIDDAAQLGTAKSDARPCGSYGDFGLVSFAQSKSIVTGVRGSGGVLLVNSEKGKALIQKDQLPLNKSRGRIFQLLYFYLAYIHGEKFGRLVYYWERLKQRLNMKATDHYKVSRISSIEAAIAYTQLQSLQQRMLNQQEKLLLAKQLLSDHNCFSLPQVAGNTYLTRLMLQLHQSVELETFRKLLASQGISTRLGYNGNKKLLEIPCKGRLSMREFEDMCNRINRIRNCQLESLGNRL